MHEDDFIILRETLKRKPFLYWRIGWFKTGRAGRSWEFNLEKDEYIEEKIKIWVTWRLSKADPMPYAIIDYVKDADNNIVQLSRYEEESIKEKLVQQICDNWDSYIH